MLNTNIYNFIITKNNFDLDFVNQEYIDTNISQKATREGFGEALLQLGKDYENVAALSADLTESTQIHKFKEVFPDRFIEVGVAEQNMAGVASGLAASGLVPFMASYAMFSPGRNWEQIRTTICYNDRKVIVVGAHAGLSVGPDGGTHQALEDIAIMRSVPNINIFSPSDYHEAYALTELAYKIQGPVYIRLAREKSPVLFSQEYYSKSDSEGVSITLPRVVYANADLNDNSHKRLGLIATGPIIFEGILAAKELEKYNIFLNVLNVNTLKYVDDNMTQKSKDIILDFIKNNKNIITLEEHQVIGGLGSMICEISAEYQSGKIHRMGIQNRFGQSGTVSELYNEYKINARAIVEKVLALV
jgi:transketolase